MDTPGDARPRLTRLRVVVLAVTGVVALVLVGLAIRVAATPSAEAALSPPLVTPTPSTAALDLASTPSPSATPMLPPAQDVLVLGDSLALSTYAWLADLMPDRHVSWEAKVGRTTAEARTALEVVAASEDLPPVIIVSSGTNDLSSSSLRVEATRILAIAGPGRCVVWADVVRPDSFGDGMTAANDALAKALTGHANVIPVAWTAIIAAHPDWLSGDGIHPGQLGNIARAQAFATAVFTCSPFDPDAPTAAKQYLPPSAFLSSGGNHVPGVGPSATSTQSPKATPSGSASPSPTASAHPSATPSEPGPTESSDPSPPPSDPPSPDPTTSTQATTSPEDRP